MRLPSRSCRAILFILLLSAALCPWLSAQSAPSILATTAGRIYGTVTDTAGNVLPGARVALRAVDSTSPRILSTDGEGSFNFTNLAPGSYRLTVTAQGFSPSTPVSVALAPGQYASVPAITLPVASTATSIRVTVSSHEIATEQVHLQEKQRVLGIVPNFYTSYIWNAEPLTAHQKFALALRITVDPATFLSTGVVAGIQQAQNTLPGYGQGGQGYAKRYGAAYTDGLIGIFLGGAVFPSLLHQDPRYFYKGTGTIRERTLYALSTVVICKGDNRRWQPNYSNIFGTFAAAGASNAYYPSADRGLQITLENSLLDLAGNAAGALVQEFLVRKISRGVPLISDSQPHNVRP